MELIGLIVLVLCYLSQVFFYRRYFRQITNNQRVRKVNEPSVSLIVCGKNEVENIKINLPALCTQEYSNYEVLYMDDHSTDNTEQVVKELCEKHLHLRYIKASESIKNKSGKKWALAEAREVAGNEVILLTDADCHPSSGLWISNMVSKFDKGIDVVLGIGHYKQEKSLVNYLLQYETLFTAMSYLGFASAGNAYMGVGRNLAYRTSIPALFEEKGMDLLSGDDDLFVQSRLNGMNAAICIDKQAYTLSNAPEGLKSWIKQKTRHYSTAFHYPSKVMSLLLLLKLSFYLPNFLVLCFLTSDYLPIIIGLFALRWLAWTGYLNKIRKSLHFQRQIYLVPCYEIFFSLFDTWITIKNLMTKPRHWK